MSEDEPVRIYLDGFVAGGHPAGGAVHSRRERPTVAEGKSHYILALGQDRAGPGHPEAFIRTRAGGNG